MKNSIKLLAAISILGFAGTAMAQNTNTATGTANANIITPISVNTDNATLNFGNIVSPQVAGDVVRPGDGTETYSAGEDPGANNYGTRGDATFVVNGDGSSQFGVTMGSVTYVTGVWGSSTFTPQDISGTYNLVSGTKSLISGGTMHVAAGQTPGSYSATWTITAAYN